MRRLSTVILVFSSFQCSKHFAFVKDAPKKFVLDSLVASERSNPSDDVLLNTGSDPQVVKLVEQ